MTPSLRSRPPRLALGTAAALLGVLVASPLRAQVACDAVQPAARFASYDVGRPFAPDPAHAGAPARTRHAVLPVAKPATAPATATRKAAAKVAAKPAAGERSRAAAARAARPGRSRKDGAGRLTVTKDHPAARQAGVRVRKDRVAAAPADSAERLFCPQVAALPFGGAGATPYEAGEPGTFESAPGEVVPQPPLPGARGGWFTLPRVLGGVILGGTAIALGNQGGGSGGTSTPIANAPGTPGGTNAPPPIGGGAGPTPPGDTPNPGPGPTPPTPPVVGPTAMPDTPGPQAGPPAPPPGVGAVVAPEPSTFALLAAGVAAAGAVARRRRR